MRSNIDKMKFEWVLDRFHQFPLSWSCAMPSKILSFDTSVLPKDVLSLHDDNFYLVAQQIAGVAEAKLLEIQGIRSVYSFLNTVAPLPWLEE